MIDEKFGQDNRMDKMIIMFFKKTSCKSFCNNKELTEKIIAAAYNVYNKMGFGFLESVYEKC